MKLIAAVDRNWGIGRAGKLLIRIPEDMRHFREMTVGKTVLMGRRTLESFPNGLPLKQRTNIVLTAKPDYDGKGALVVHSLPEMLEEAAKYPGGDVFCIGGETLYRQLLPYCDEAFVTKIDYAYEADAWLQDLDRDPEWILSEEGEEQTYFDIPYCFCRYKRSG